jgi:hypothetical protein
VRITATPSREIRSRCINIFIALIVASITRPAGLEAQQPTPATNSNPKPSETQRAEKSSTSQESAEEKPRSGWAALPIIYYTPETELGLGGFTAHFFRIGNAPASTRPSSLAMLAIYTIRDQFMVEMIPELYWGWEKWHIWSKLDYRLYPNSFWGVGNHTAESDKEAYTENTPRLQFSLRRLLYFSFYLEGRLDAQYLLTQNTSTNGLLASGSVLGATGGRTVGLGLTLGWDTRDHALEPHRGSLYELSGMAWEGPFGSEYTFSELTLNLRQYLPITPTQVLALQFYGQLQGGEVPFYKMALLGGQRLLRGYLEGRYRDKELLALQAEYRLPIFWRFGAVLFFSLGEVSDRLSHFSFDRFKWTAGCGGRAMINSDERLNLRVDMAFGYGTWGLYATATEAF